MKREIAWEVIQVKTAYKLQWTSEAPKEKTEAFDCQADELFFRDYTVQITICKDMWAKTWRGHMSLTKYLKKKKKRYPPTPDEYTH